MSDVLEVGGSMLLSSALASLSASSNVSQHALDLLTEHLFDYQSACMIVGQAALETALMPCWTEACPGPLSSHPHCKLFPIG